MTARSDFPAITETFNVRFDVIGRMWDEIDRLRELIRRALADGMDVLDEDDYDLYNELATYLLTESERRTNP